MDDSFVNTLITRLNRRRKNLGISQARLARMVGVSLPTIQRLFSRTGRVVSLETVGQVASVLGMTLHLQESLSEPELTQQRARERARELSRLVQGTSALENQGLSEESLRIIEQQILLDLLKKPRAQLWSE